MGRRRRETTVGSCFASVGGPVAGGHTSSNGARAPISKTTQRLGCQPHVRHQAFTSHETLNAAPPAPEANPFGTMADDTSLNLRRFLRTF
eukprot:g32635.t1